MSSETLDVPVLYQWGSYSFDPATRTVTGLECPVVLTERLSQILTLIVAAQGAIVQKEDVYKTMLSTGGYRPAPKIVDVTMCHLRKRLGPAGAHIQTVWGKGYCLALDPDSTPVALKKGRMFRNVRGRMDRIFKG